MANSMTKKQIQDINNKCKNNWKFDVVYFVYHEGKTLIKKFKQDEAGYLECRLCYNSENQIIVHISKFMYAKDKETATSEELGKITILDETRYSRRNINNLIMVTSRLTDDELLKINAETEVNTSNGVVLKNTDI